MQFVFLNLTSPTHKKMNFDSLTAKKQKCTESKWSWELRFADIRWVLQCAGRLNWGSNSEHDSGLGHPSHDLLPFVAVNPTLLVPKNGWSCEWDNFNKFQTQQISLQKKKHQKPQTNNHLKPIHNGSFKPLNLPSAPCWCHDRVREGLLPRKPGWTGWSKVHLRDVLRSEGFLF